MGRRRKGDGRDLQLGVVGELGFNNFSCALTPSSADLADLDGALSFSRITSLNDSCWLLLCE